MANGSGRPSKIGFGLLQMSYWCSYGAFTTYFVAYGTQVRGLSASMAGLFVSIFMLAGCAGQFLVNAVCDRFQNNRKIFLGGLIAVLILYYALYYAPSIGALAVLYALLGFIQPAISPVMDTWIIRSYPDQPEAFGPIRGTASITYAVMMFCEGFAIERFGYGVMLILGTAFIAVGVVIAVLMPEIPRVQHLQGKGEKLRFSVIPHMVLWMVGALALLGMANAPVLQLTSVVMEELGGSVTHMGIAIAANALSEFPLMCMAKYLLRFKASTRLLVSAALLTASTLLMMLASSPVLIIIMCGFSGAAYGILMIARRQLVTENVPEGMQNRVHGMGDAAYISFGGFAGNLIGGSILENVGARMMLLVCGLIHLCGTALTFVMCRCRKQKVSRTVDI